MRRLTVTEAAILRELDRLAGSGGLTGNLARRLFGPIALSARVRRPCLVLASIGLVERHPANDQRWFITPAGRVEVARAASALVATTEGQADG